MRHDCLTHHRRILSLIALSGLLVFAGCDDGDGTTDLDGVGDADQTSDTPDDGDAMVGFDDHTVQRLESVAAYEAIAKTGAGGNQVAKFLIADIRSDSPGTRYFDANFYTLHDEWYWFRLLNGEPAPGSATAPVLGRSFATIAEIYTWAESLDPTALPLDLRFVNGDRLYSPEFYELALQEPRAYGVGSIIRVAERTEAPVRPEIWAFELEYQDRLDYDLLTAYFENLEPSLPSDVGPALKWLVRSPDQEALAQEVEAEQWLYHDRILRYDDIIVPGEIEVYAEGITAGRVLLVPAGDPAIETSRDTDLLMLEIVPDYLPPAAGLITATPQTPLAHVNVLARNRGIPNAYLGGLLNDPEVDQLGRVRAPAILRAVAPDQLDLVAMTETEFATWRDLQTTSPISVPPVDVSTMPTTIDLETLAPTITDEEALDALRPTIGGKAAGFVGLLAPGTVTTPDAPMVITVKAYLEHLEALETPLSAMLANASFRSSSRGRFLLLEGPQDYSERYTTADDLEFRNTFFAANPASSPVGAIVRAGGFKQLLRDTPMNAATLAEIEAAVEAQYPDYALSQGLRFRSSSSVEDIEGFNGAGLYDSNTGFIDPSAADPGDAHKSIEWAVKKTWASYWGSEAFEERELESVSHTSGAMAVLVHARFDDPLEVDNGVFTLTRLPDGFADRYVMELNVQDGDESVTNPTPGLGALPEVDIVRLADGGSPQIERRAASNLVSPGTLILDDADLLEIFGQAIDVTEAWVDRTNASLPPEQAISTLTLDFEFREMAPGWPALAMGPQFAQRIVIKQSRTLEPGLREVPETLTGLPVPRDILARSVRGDRRVCSGGALRLTTVEVLTDPLAYPDFGYSTDPFSVFVSLEAVSAIPEAGLGAGQTIVLPWSEYTASHPGLVGGGPWDLRLDLPADAASGREAMTITIADGGYAVAGSGGTASGDIDCEQTVLMTTPKDYLATLLNQKLGE